MKKLFAALVFLFLASVPARAQLGTIQGFCDNGGNHSLTSGQPSSNYLQGNIPLCTVSVYYHDTTTLAPIFMGESSTGTVQSVQVTTGGSYSVCPTGVTFTGGGGSGATATVSCTAGAVVSVAVTSPGSGYTTAPTVAFTGGTGSGAAATATIVGDLTNPFTANIDGSWRVWASVSSGYDITLSGGIPPNAYAQPRTIANVFPNAYSNAAFTIIQANGIASAPTSPVNFVNSTTVDFSISANQITAAVNAGTLLAIQHNSSATGIDQSLLNFCDNGACGGAVDTGYNLVKWLPDTGGGLAAEYLAGLGLTTLATQPVAGQATIVYPSSSTVTLCDPGGAYGYGYSTPTLTNNTTLPGSGVVYQQNGGVGSCISKITWNWSAPGGNVTDAYGNVIPVANITAVYTQVVDKVDIVTHQVNTDGALTCTGTGLTFPGYSTANDKSIPLTTYNATTSLTVSTANINALSCTASISQISGLVNGPNNGKQTVPLVQAWVYYTGTALPTGNVWNVVYPLTLDQSKKNFSIDLPYYYADAAGTNTYSATDSAFTNYTSGLTLNFCPANANTGASTMNLNGAGAWPILSAAGAALTGGELKVCSATVPPTTITLGYTGAGNYEWFLQGSGGGTTTNALTAAASGGAAPGSTFNGSAAVTFDYHSFGAAGLAAANTFTGANVNDFSATSQLKLPTAASFVTAANGEIGFDSTNLNYHVWNGADTVLVPLAGTFASGDCGEPTLTGGKWTFVDTGSPCGTGGSGTGFNGGLGTSYQDATEIAAPANPSAGNDRLWLDSTTHQLSCHTSSGASCMPAGGSGTVFCTPNAQTGITYTLVLTDGTASGSACIGTLTMNNAASNTVTVPPNSSVAFPVPDEIDFMQLGVGQTTIVAGAGVTLNSSASLSMRAQYSTIFCRQIATDIWNCGGDTQ